MGDKAVTYKSTKSQRLLGDRERLLNDIKKDHWANVYVICENVVAQGDPDFE